MSDEPEPAVFKSSDLSHDQKLLEAVYPEIGRLASRLMAAERPSPTLQPTALANEALIRLLNVSETHFQSRAEFYKIASKIMRMILVDHARSKNGSQGKGTGYLSRRRANRFGPGDVSPAIRPNRSTI